MISKNPEAPCRFADKNDFVSDRAMTDLVRAIATIICLALAACGGGSGNSVPNNLPPPKLTLVNKVINDNGGMAAAADWTLTAEGYNSTAPVAGTYALSESGPPGYAQTSITCSNSGEAQVVSVTLSAGEDVTCTFINDDIPPKLTLIKEVINDNGGTAQPDQWVLYAYGYDAAAPVVGTYALSENFGPAGYTLMSLTCSNSGDAQVFTVTLGLGEDVTCTFINRYEPAIELSIAEPLNHTFSGAELTVIALVRSELDIVEVRATVADRQSQLVYSPDSRFGQGKRCEDWPGACFAGVMFLEGLARGAYSLEVLARDVDGREVRSVKTFVFDKQPELTVSAPATDTVATPSLHVALSCIDDDPAGCELVVSDGTQGGWGNELVRGRNAIDTEIDLSAYDSGPYSIHFRATDSVGQETSVSRRIYVETSSVISEVFTVFGSILDVTSNKILHRVAEDGGDRLEVTDWIIGTTDAVSLPAGKRVTSKHFLTPFGAIFVTEDVGGNVLSSRLYDWNQGVLDDLGLPNSASSLAVSGNFAIWNSDGDARGVILTRRDLVSRSNLVVSQIAGSSGNDAASNGTVAYWTTDHQVELFVNGVTTPLTNDVGLWNTHVLTDGTRTVYRKSTPCCGNQTYAIVLHDGSDEIVLRAAQSLEATPGRDYQIVPGWVAYTDIGNLGQKHVWLYDPSGQRQQLTYFGAASTIDTLGENGEVMLLSGQRRYLATPDGKLTEVASSSGNAYWIEGQWYVAIGTSLFRVTL